MRTLPWIMLLVPATITAAEPLQTLVAKYKDEKESYRSHYLNLIKKHIANVKNNRRITGSQQKLLIGKLGKELNGVQNRSLDLPEIHLTEARLKAETISWLGTVHVEEVIDDGNAIIRVTIPKLGSDLAAFPLIIDFASASRSETTTKDIWLRHNPSQTFADNTDIEVNALHFVAGTKIHKGTTLFVLEPVNR